MQFFIYDRLDRSSNKIAMALFGGGNTMFGQQAVVEPQDIKLNNGPADGIACMAFSQNNLLAVGSWDSMVRVWQVQRAGNQIQSAELQQQKYDGPVLCAAFKPEGDMLFTGGADNTVRLLNMQTNQTLILGRHDQPVKSIHWLPVHNLVVTGSWDATVRFWSPGKPGAEVFKLQLKHKVYAMDVSYPMMVVSTAETGNNNSPVLHAYDITFQSGQPVPLHQLDSTLKHQTRCVAMLPCLRARLIVPVAAGPTYTNPPHRPGHRDCTNACVTAGAHGFQTPSSTAMY